MNKSVVLQGLEGANPLGFLAAVGTLRVLTSMWPAEDVRMSWIARDAWRPILHLSVERSEEQIAEEMAVWLSTPPGISALRIGDNLNLPAAGYREHCLSAAASARPGAQGTADFMAAFACDGVHDEGTVSDTAFRTMSGAGHQHFLGVMRQLVEDTKAKHIGKALFEPWTYDDPLEKHSMRWDPSDDTRYALRWRDPSGDPERRKGGAMWGANRLAIEALPLFPVAPVSGRLVTTGFRGKGARDTYWTWPLWEPAIRLETLRSLLAFHELQERTPDRERLASMGIAEVFRAQRLTVGKFRNFTAGQPV